MRLKNYFYRSALVAVVLSVLGGRLAGQTLTTIFTFNGRTNGTAPYASLILSGDTLYGTTREAGGGGGTVFKINIDGTGFRTLHSFNGSNDGIDPSAALILSGNTLYGTAGFSSFPPFSGTVFKLSADGTGFTTLHTFKGGSDGAHPWGGLIFSSNTLYGTTGDGGSSSNGTVFAVNMDGSGFTLLHSFSLVSDGGSPYGGLILSSNTLFGTTYSGGSSGEGTVFAIRTDGTGFTNLHSFNPASDGGKPYSSLILSGNILYGTASDGGTSGQGTVFALNTDGTGFTNLHSFLRNTDGGAPRGALVLSGGVLYGTTSGGGNSGTGTIFKLNTDGSGFQNLYSFTATSGETPFNNSDGARPYAGLIDSDNVLYGTTSGGGGSGNGTLFALSLLVSPPRIEYICTTNNGMITITRYIGPGGDVTIPSTLNNLPVTSIGMSAFDGSTSLTSITIPSSITNIGNGAFYGCTSLSNATILNGLASVGAHAFAFCYRLIDVAIPASVTNIGTGAFSDCTSLHAITVDAANAAYGSLDGVLFDKSLTTLIQYPTGNDATSYTIPGDVTNIWTRAFEDCHTLTSVTIPSSVTSMGPGAFEGCTNLTSITIPSSITNLPPFSFRDCVSLTNVTMGGEVTSIGDGTFSGCIKLTSITIPAVVGSIGNYAFSDCLSLGSVTIPGSVTTLGESAFQGCTNLTSVTMPDSITNIPRSLFAGCVNLTSVTIPASVSSIGESAFSGCSPVSIAIPASVTNIGIGAFYSTSLLAISVDAANAAYSSLDGVLFDKSLTTLIQYPIGKGTTSYTVPDGVTSIGSEAFFDCTGLTRVTIPESATNIGGGAFYGCTNLTSVRIPAGVASIDGTAFYGCTGLSSVTIGNAVTNIGNGTFQGCSNLTAVYFEGNAPNVDFFAFDGVNATAYYLPGTKGWSSVFAGLTTTLWPPQVQPGDASFGVNTNQFGFNVYWASGKVVVVEVSSDLISPLWFPAATNALPNGSFYFSDPQWTNHPARFYRVRSQ